MQVGWEGAGVSHLLGQLLSSAPTSRGAAVPLPGFCTPVMLLVQSQQLGLVGSVPAVSLTTQLSHAAAGPGKAAESLQ